jgi:hypothetical protein
MSDATTNIKPGSLTLLSILLMSLAAPVFAQPLAEFTVESGKYTRVDTPVSCQLEGLASLPPAAIER